jgi:undecaprenyl-diphosphatase
MTLPESARNAVQRFDEWADGQLERVRGTAGLDQVMSAASHLGDFSVIWHLINVGRGATSPRRARQAFVLSVLIGAESLIVNQGVKRLFRRTRPTETGDPRFPVRRPSTSSFPSGHASAAFFAATVLTHWGGRRSAPAWFAVATVVGTSRAYVRIHHASDVVGGAAVGIVLGRLATRAVAATGIAGRR